MLARLVNCEWHLGTDDFWKGIRIYYQRYRNGGASTADFRGIMEDVSGKKLDWFFDQWLRQGGLPTITGIWSHSNDELQLRLRQTQPDYHFRLPLEVQLTFDDGSTQHETILLNAAEESFRFATVRTPQTITLDPNEWMLIQSEIKQANK